MKGFAVTKKKAFFGVSAVGLSVVLGFFFSLRPKPPLTEKEEVMIRGTPDSSSEENISSLTEEKHVKEGSNVQEEPLEQKGIVLRLIGTYEHANETFAYIEDGAFSSVRRYATGEKIRGYTIIRILSNKVMLHKEGKVQTLTLGDGIQVAGSGNWINVVSENRFVVRTMLLRSVLSDVNQLFAEATPLAYMLNGRFEGVQISSLSNEGILSQAGLKEGDIITSVNGTKIDDFRKPYEIYASLQELVHNRQEADIEVELKRQDQKHIFTYRLVHN